jgi:acetyl-CoA carboxylase carboxyltransferase component
MAVSIIKSPLPGIVLNIACKEGDTIRKGEDIIIIEAMKMENAITAPDNILIKSVYKADGDVIKKDDPILSFDAIAESDLVSEVIEENTSSLGQNNAKELKERREFLLDKNRGKATEKRRKKGYNTARENLDLLVDEDSFQEYGGLIIAAQLSRRSKEDLIKETPADGLIAGTATINANDFEKNTECAILIYDYSVLAGTQGTMNHLKMDRVLEIAHRSNLPTILFAEGGGGRPGDVDQQTIAGLHISTFYQFAALNGKVPLISIVNGYCFAGNAALAGSSEIIIATKSISLGMGGPAMIEGGGLGSVGPKEVGPYEVHLTNGVIDILVENETEAIDKAKQYLSYFQGDSTHWELSDQTTLNSIIPENRKRVYNVRELVITLFDVNSVLELRQWYGSGIITCLARIEGIPVAVVANDPSKDAGAITHKAAVKLKEFLELVNTHKLPIISLVDTPGIMVGPESEKTGNVKHASRLFVASARLEVPLIGIVTRRAYGLGAMAMVGGSMHIPHVMLAWPSGEFGAMGLEGAVKLGFRKELEAVEEPKAREELFEQMVALAYERGKAMSMATAFEIDDVIQPHETRQRIIQSLKSSRGKYES